MSITEKLFRENETRTNKLGIWCILGITIVAAIFAILIVTGLVNTKFEWTGWLIIVGCSIELSIFFIVKTIGYSDKRAKGFVLVGLVFLVGLNFFIFPLASVFGLGIPILISINYYNTKLTSWVSIIVWFVFMLSVFANVVFEIGIPILHDMHVEQGMLLWSEVPFTLKYYITPISCVLAIIGVASYCIAKAGKRMVIEQAKVSVAAANLSAELDTASKIQLASLPKACFVTPNGNIEIDAYIKPAKNVGGDLYDYFMVGSHHLVVIVADVSDKGLPSAMYGVEAQSYIRFAFSENIEKNIENDSDTINLEKALNSVNRQLTIHNMDGMFVTMWIGCIDTLTGRGQFVNAGHCSPYIKSSDGTIQELSNEPQVFLGTFEDAELRACDFEMNDGDSLVLYTDGVTDARNSNDETYGESRLKSIISKTITQGEMGPSKSIADAVIKDIEEFIGEETQFDDITLEVIHFEKNSNEHASKLEVQIGVDCASKVIDFVNSSLDNYNYSEELRRNIDVVVDEICDNINSYAYDGADGNIKVDLRTNDEHINLCFTDSGKKFNPLEADAPTMEGEPQIGGLGIHFVKTLADKVEYRHENGKNILTVEIKNK